MTTLTATEMSWALRAQVADAQEELDWALAQADGDIDDPNVVDATQALDALTAEYEQALDDAYSEGR